MSRSDVVRIPFASGQLAARVFEPEQLPSHQIILLHGIVSHSEWLVPIGQRVSRRGVRVIAVDRRGSGLSSGPPGDAESVAVLLDDVRELLQYFQREDCVTHFGGFCWGATYALNALLKDSTGVGSFVMIAPSIFPALAITGRELVLGDSGEAQCEPTVPIDLFTEGPAYEAFIVPDPLRTRLTSPRFNRCVAEMNRLIAVRWSKLRMPTTMILAETDQMSDNEKHLRAWRHVRGVPKSHIMVPGGHGVQFDAPDETANALVDWVKRVDGDTQLSAEMIDPVPSG